MACVIASIVRYINIKIPRIIVVLKSEGRNKKKKMGQQFSTTLMLDAGQASN